VVGLQVAKATSWLLRAFWGASWGVGDAEVVDGDVEDFGEADSSVEAGGAVAAFVAQDGPGI